MARTVGALTVSPERKAQIIADVLPRLAAGETTESIAASHNITGRTIRAWLISDASIAAEQARAEYLAADIARWQDEIEAATDTIPLARAREGFRAAAWVAERRAPNLFGQRNETTVKHVGLDLDSALAGARQALQGRTIDVTPTIVSDPTE